MVEPGIANLEVVTLPAEFANEDSVVVGCPSNYPSDDDVTVLVSRDQSSSILANSDADDQTTSPSLVVPPTSGELNLNSTVSFITPVVGDIPSLTILEECMQGACSCSHLIGGRPAQLKPCRAAKYLFGPDSLESVSDEDKFFLWEGLMCGFKIVDADCSASYVCENYDSITGDEFSEEMTALLLKELQEHKVSKVSAPPQCVHALGAVKKSDGRLRPITDCSRPDGASINNFMETTFKSFSYNSVDSAVQVLKQEDFMAVVDISSAYRSVSVHADHSKFQGFTWDFGEGKETLIDNRLCFGLRCAPNIFDSLSSFIVKIAISEGASHVINYLDDFLIISPSEEQCLAERKIVTDTITHLGFGVSWKKVTAPSQVTTFLGITIDSVAMELSLPLAKVEKLQLAIRAILDKGSATKRELECIGGLVSHCSYVVRGGRTFSRRIFDLSASYSRNSKSIPLDEGIRADFDWWLSFCHTFNGKACILQDLHPIPMYSDSSFLGFGAWMGRDWLAGCWNEPDIPTDFSFGCSHLSDPPAFDSAPRNINVLELWPVVVGLRRWGIYFRNCYVHVITDNMQVLAMLLTGRSSNKICMTWLREIFWMCFIWNLDISPSYIRSADNHLADALSRLPYKGVTSSCTVNLSNLNMCCSPPYRTCPSPVEAATEDTTRCSTSRIYEEV